VSTSDDIRPGHPDSHVEEELPALLGGELDLDSTRAVTGHLRSCPDCRSELVEVSAGISVMRRFDQSAAVSVAVQSADGADDRSIATAVPISAAGKQPRSRSHTTRLLAAAVVLVLAGVVTTAALLTNRDRDRPDATVALAPASDRAAKGSVAMTAIGATQTMEVDTSLGAAPRDTYYEVWLIDRNTGKVLPVGVLPPDGHGDYRLPGSILEQYDTVDISLQPDDGSTQHSSDSVLRADYA